MKKHGIMGLALLVVVVCSAATTQSALAEVHLWLIAGADVTTLTAVTSEGTLILIDTKVPIVGKASISCSVIFDGSVGAEGEFETTEVLNLETVKLQIALGTLALLCINNENCNEPEAYPQNLPWHGVLSLMAGMAVPEETLGIVKGTLHKPAWEVVCHTVVGTLEDLCEAVVESELGYENMAAPDNDVLALFDTETGLTALSECTLSKESSGHIVGELLMTTAGGALAVSSP